jgi:hypothetical protein
MSFYTNREKIPRSYSSWALEEYPNPAKKGRENELITFYRGRLTAYGCELDLRRESIKSSEEGEREYV